MRNIFLLLLMCCLIAPVYADRCRVQNSWGNTYDVECDNQSGNRLGINPTAIMSQALGNMHSLANAPTPLDAMRSRQLENDSAQMSREQHDMQMKLLELELQKKQMELERLRQQSAPVSNSTSSSNQTEPFMSGETNRATENCITVSHIALEISGSYKTSSWDEFEAKSEEALKEQNLRYSSRNNLIKIWKEAWFSDHLPQVSRSIAVGKCLDLVNAGEM